MPQLEVPGLTRIDGRVDQVVRDRGRNVEAIATDVTGANDVDKGGAVCSELTHGVRKRTEVVATRSKHPFRRDRRFRC